MEVRYRTKVSSLAKGGYTREATVEIKNDIAVNEMLEEAFPQEKP